MSKPSTSTSNASTSTDTTGPMVAGNVQSNGTVNDTNSDSDSPDDEQEQLQELQCLLQPPYDSNGSKVETVCRGCDCECGDIGSLETHQIICPFWVLPRDEGGARGRGQ